MTRTTIYMDLRFPRARPTMTSATSDAIAAAFLLSTLPAT